MTDYNAFIQANTNVVKVYVPKSVRLNGGSVLAPYQITRGTLPSVAVSKNAAGVLVSDISVGSLVIGAQTTVADLSAAIVGSNVDWEDGDQVTFFYGVQTTDAVTGIPRARIYGYKLLLDVADDTLLTDAVDKLGFSAVDGHLGMDRAIADGAAVWVHSREDASSGSGSGLRVSTQYLFVASSVLSSYQNAEAMQGAANSYGGINESAVYLKPGSKWNISVGQIGGSGSGSGSGTGSGSGSASGSGSGSDTGGGSGSGSGGGNEDDENPEQGLGI